LISSLIQIEDLTKYYGKHLGGSVDLKVGQGEVSGFIGSNGAAKTTPLRILQALLRKNARKVSLLGREWWWRSRARIDATNVARV